MFEFESCSRNTDSNCRKNMFIRKTPSVWQNPGESPSPREGNFANVQGFLKDLKVLEQSFLLSRLRLQNLQIDSWDSLLSLELELTQAIVDEVYQ